jgi:hypothetical protein
MQVTHVVVTSPNGGESLTGQSDIEVTWSLLDPEGVDHVAILFSEDSGANFSLVEDSVTGTSAYLWPVPPVNSSECVVRIEAHYDGGMISVDESDSTFTIVSTATGADVGRPPEHFELHPNYPNPFNPTTTVEFSVPKSSRVIIRVHDVSGRHISTLTDRVWTEGRHAVSWNGRDRQGVPVASGVYSIQMDAESFYLTRKIVLLK